MRHAVSLLFLGLATALAFQANAEPSTDRIDRLIATLGSGDFADREQAMVSLTAIGGSALDALRKAAASDDLEIRRRAEELIRRIERREDSTRLLAGKRIRLSFQDSPVEQALAELNRLTGFSWRINPADLPQLAGTKITLQTDEIPVWEALDKFCAKAGLLVPEAGSNAARSASLLLGAAPAVPTCYSGAIRIRALIPPTPGWGQTAGVFEVGIPLEIASEPKLQWHGVADVVVLRAVDDKGQELEQSAPDRESTAIDSLEQELMWAGRRGKGVWQKQDLLDLSDIGQSRQICVRLKLGREKARLITHLQGTLVGPMDTPVESLAEVNDILRASGKTATAKDGSVLKIGDIKHDDIGAFQVAIDFQAAPDDLRPIPVNNRRLMMNQAIVMQLGQELRGTPGPPQFEIRDAQGRLFEIVRYNEASQINGNTSQYTATLHALRPKGVQVGEPAKLVLIGRRTVTVEIPFTLKDVPLP